MNDDQRCQSCKHWDRNIDAARGTCTLLSARDTKAPARTPTPLAAPDPPSCSYEMPGYTTTHLVKLRTHPHFGCVQWEP